MAYLASSYPQADGKSHAAGEDEHYWSDNGQLAAVGQPLHRDSVRHVIGVPLSETAAFVSLGSALCPPVAFQETALLSGHRYH